MVDIYADLENFDFSEELDKVKNEKRKLEEKIAQLETENMSLTTKCASLEAKFNIVNENISSLLKTSKAEIERKDKTIVDLRTQLDDITFRRRNRFTIPKISQKPVDQCSGGKKIDENNTKVPYNRQQSNINNVDSRRSENKIRYPVNDYQSSNSSVASGKGKEITSTVSKRLGLSNPFSSDKVEQRRMRLTKLEFEKDYQEAENIQRLSSSRASKRGLSPTYRQSDRHERVSRDSPGSYSREYKKSSSPYIPSSNKHSRSPHRRRSRSPNKKQSRSPHRKIVKSPPRKRLRSPFGKHSRSPLRRQSKSPIGKRPQSRGSSRGGRSRSPIRKRLGSPFKNSRSPYPNNVRENSYREKHDSSEKRNSIESNSSQKNLSKNVVDLKDDEPNLPCTQNKSPDIKEEIEKHEEEYIDIYGDLESPQSNDASHQINCDNENIKTTQDKIETGVHKSNKNNCQMFKNSGIDLDKSLEDGEIKSEDDEKPSNNDTKNESNFVVETCSSEKVPNLMSNSRLIARKNRAKLEFSFTDTKLEVPKESVRNYDNERSDCIEKTNQVDIKSKTKVQNDKAKKTTKPEVKSILQNDFPIVGSDKTVCTKSDNKCVSESSTSKSDNKCVSESSTSKSDNKCVSESSTSKSDNKCVSESSTSKSDNKCVSESSTSKSDNKCVSESSTSKSDNKCVSESSTSKSDNKCVSESSTSKSDNKCVSESSTSKSDNKCVSESSTSKSDNKCVSESSTSKSDNKCVSESSTSKAECIGDGKVISDESLNNTKDKNRFLLNKTNLINCSPEKISNILLNSRLVARKNRAKLEFSFTDDTKSDSHNESDTKKCSENVNMAESLNDKVFKTDFIENSLNNRDLKTTNNINLSLKDDGNSVDVKTGNEFIKYYDTLTNNAKVESDKANVTNKIKTDIIMKSPKVQKKDEEKNIQSDVCNKTDINEDRKTDDCGNSGNVVYMKIGRRRTVVKK